MRELARSDLIGIPATIVGVIVFLLPVAVFIVLGIVVGPVTLGIVVATIFAVIIWGGTAYLISRAIGGSVDISDLAPPAQAQPHRILVIGNEGLEGAEQVAEVARRGAEEGAQIMVLAPVVSSSRVRALADDIDADSRRARERLDAATKTLAERGLAAEGNVDEEGTPGRCLLDGLRAFPAHEVLLLVGGEPGWGDARTLAERVRSEVGIPVTEIAGSGSASG